MNTCSHSRLASAALALWLLAIASLSAGQFGDFTYEAFASTITITSCSDDAVGEAVIPSEIEGMPVTEIRGYAFADCTGLTLAGHIA